MKISLKTVFDKTKSISLVNFYLKNGMDKHDWTTTPFTGLKGSDSSLLILAIALGVSVTGERIKTKREGNRLIVWQSSDEDTFHIINFYIYENGQIIEERSAEDKLIHMWSYDADGRTIKDFTKLCKISYVYDEYGVVKQYKHNKYWFVFNEAKGLYIDSRDVEYPTKLDSNGRVVMYEDEFCKFEFIYDTDRIVETKETLLDTDIFYTTKKKYNDKDELIEVEELSGDKMVYSEKYKYDHRKKTLTYENSYSISGVYSLDGEIIEEHIK
jgi:hypothetical protein